MNPAVTHHETDYVPDTTGNIPPYQVYLTDLVKPVVTTPDTMKGVKDTILIYTESIFKGHALKPHHQEVITKQQEGLGDWVVGVLLVSLLLTAWIQVFYPKRIRQVFRAIIVSRQVNPLLREGNIYSERISVVLVLIFLLSYALLVTFFTWRISPLLLSEISPFIFFLSVTVAITMLYFLRLFAMKITGKIFKNDLRNEEYLLNIFIFDMAAGMVTLPFLIFFAFYPVSIILYVVTGLILSLYLYRVFRGVVIGLSPGKFSAYHFILYFCTLELLPILIVIKIVLELT